MRYPAGATAAAVIFAFGSAGAATNTWDGGGDSNNGGSWNTATNWSSDTVPGPGDIAVLPEVTSGIRTITVDTNATVAELDWDPDQGSEDYIVLNANLTVGDLNNINHRNSHLDVNGRRFTITNGIAGGSGNWSQFPATYGTGEIVKDGAFTFNMEHDVWNTFTGQITVTNGTLRYGAYPRISWSSAVVHDGATIEYGNGAFVNQPPPVTIRGPGYNDNGAINFPLNRNQTKDITLAAAATIHIDGGVVVYMEAELRGDHPLTIKGGGEFIVQNTIAACTNAIIVSNATLTVPAELTAVTGITVQAGGVLNGAACHFPNAVVTLDGGAWNDQDSTIVWSGNGDPNNSGNWSDTNNWFCYTVPGTGDVATLPEVSSGVRTVTVDTAVSIAELNWDPDQGNEDYIRLEADLTVGDLNFINHRNSLLDINGHRFTITNGVSGGNGNWAQFPATYGTGEIVKDGIFTLSIEHDIWNNYTGQITVTNGTLRYGTYPRISWGNAVVHDGATIKYDNAAEVNRPPPATISGPGYNDQGALNFALTRDHTKPITLATNATIHIDAGRTVFMKAPIYGCYTLTIKGGGEMSIDIPIAACSNMMIILSNATLTVPTEITGVSNITVQAGGVLNGSQPHFPDADIVLDGGVWNQIDEANGWSGNGNPDNSGNWSESNNWYGLVVPTNTALFLAVTGTSTRVVTVDVATAVATLDWTGTGGDKDRISLDANLTVGTFKGYHNAANCRLYMNGHTVSVANACADWQFCYPYEGGVIEKLGTWQWKLEFTTAPAFTGEWRVVNGTIYLPYYHRLYNSSRIDVRNGATLRHDSDGPNCPALTLNGPGYNDGGALHTTRATTYDEPITIASDATIKTDSGETMGLTADLDGPGVLTLVGGGSLDLDNEWTFTLGGPGGNGIVASNGTVDIAGCTLTLTNVASPQANQYVVVDYSAAAGSSVGAFAATNGLRTGWTIEYAGTVKHPDSVVLQLPPLGSLVMLR